MIPLPYLPAPVGVLEWDIADSMPPIHGYDGFRVVRVLVRHSGRSLGWISLEEPVHPISVARLASDAVNQLGWPLEMAALHHSIADPETPDMGELPPITVVVCTRDRAESLRRCLDSLHRVDYPGFEVIVVDNASSTDDTSRVTADFPFRYVRENRPGLDWARNRGVAEARHDIIAFTDDDVVVDRLWLKGVAAGFARPDVMLVTGLVVPGELETEAQVAFEYRYGGMSKGFRATRWDPAGMKQVDLIGTHHLGLGANMAFRRQIFERIGTFDTALDVGTPSHGAGDLDMFHRVLTSGGVAQYQPDALVWHFHRRDLAALHRQLRDNGRAFGAYLLSQAFPNPPRRDALKKRRIFGYALFIWLRWMAGRVVRRFARKETLSLPLQFSEIRGVLQAPWAFLATRRSDRRIRRDTALRAP